MTRPRGADLTEGFFEQLHSYLLRQKSAADCANSLRKMTKRKTLSTNTFLNWVYEAYIQGYLVLRTKSDQSTKNDLLTYINSHLHKVIIPHVAAGKPSHDMFALFAAECVINILKNLLEENRAEISLGVVSGTSVCETIRQVVESSLWDDIIGPEYTGGGNLKKINVVTLSIPPAVREEVYGNAIAGVVAFAKFLAQKLQCKVMPYGMTSPLIVNDRERALNDIINSEQLEIVDPARLQKSKRLIGEEERKGGNEAHRSDADSRDMPARADAHRTHGDTVRPDKTSRLDMVLLGAGPKQKQSVFTKVLSIANLDWPVDAIGDVGFIPMNQEGKRTQLYNQRNEEVFVYGLLSDELMRDLVADGKKVVLIARNSRLIHYTADSEEQQKMEKTDKVESIRAAIRGGFCNFLITDKAAADAIMARDNGR